MRHSLMGLGLSLAIVPPFITSHPSKSTAVGFILFNDCLDSLLILLILGQPVSTAMRQVTLSLWK